MRTAGTILIRALAPAGIALLLGAASAAAFDAQTEGAKLLQRDAEWPAPHPKAAMSKRSCPTEAMTPWSFRKASA
jgi:hypothetical protein